MSELKPLLKWCGGKRQLLPEIRKYYPKNFNYYREPFIGAGAVLLDLLPQNAFINDINTELIDLYNVVKNYPEQLILELKNSYLNIEKDYYEIRNWDRCHTWPRYFPIWKRAARTIYLNKTCFNGLYRVNSKGQFNAPYGKYKQEFIPDIENILAVSKYLNSNNIEITNQDFQVALRNTQPQDFIYFDSPYLPVSETSNFTSYTKDGFTKEDQIRLRDCFKKLSERECYCLLSNSGVDFIRDLYKDFKIVEIEARRNVNCKGDKRGKVSEVLIMNY